MLAYLKYLPQVFFLFKDVSQTYKEEKKEDRPIALSRRFVSAVVGAVLIIIGMIAGVQFDEFTAETIVESWMSIALSAGVLWTFVLQIWGWIDRKRKPTAGEAGFADLIIVLAIAMGFLAAHALSHHVEDAWWENQGAVEIEAVEPECCETE